MKQIALLIFLTVLAVSVHAQTLAPQLPDTPQQPTTPKIFWVAVGADSVGIALDIYTTRLNIQRGGYEINSWEFGRHPSTARLIAMDYAQQFGEVLLARHLVRSHSKFWRSTGYALMGCELANRWHAVATN
jgi:hypothetical protein